jgi:erythromycin esterase-like protein
MRLRTKPARLLAAALAVGLAVGCATRPAAEPDATDPAEAVSDDEFVEWVKANALPVQPWEMNGELEAYLDRALEKKRIVFIGEPGHFFAEKYDVQFLLIRHLVSRGYRHIFQEGLGASMAPAFDEFVQTGVRPGSGDEQGVDDEVVRYRERAFAGWQGAKNPEFGKRVSAGRLRFFERLHQLNRSLPEDSPPLRVHALDIDMLPGGCYHSISTMLAAHADRTELKPVLALATKQDDETPEQEIARLEELRDLVGGNPDGLLDVMDPDERRRLGNYADCLVESIAFLETARADGKLDRALVRREPAMFRQAQFVLETLPPDAKMIMLAHTNHLAKVGADTTRARKPSVGEMVDRAHPGQVFSIWLLHDHGELLNPINPDLFETLESDPERIESLMVKAGSTYVLPLGTGEPGERYLATKRDHSYFSWSETSTLGLQTDAIFFLDEISPLKE